MFSKEKFVSLMWTLAIAIVLAVGGYIVSVGDLWQLDVHTLVNVAFMAGFSTLVTFIKLMGTNEDTGKFLGTQVRALPDNQ